MKKAAVELGLSYDEATHKLTDGPTGTAFETVDGVIDYVKSVKEQLDGCKKVTAPAKEQENNSNKYDIFTN